LFAFNPTSFASGFEFFIPGGEDSLVPAGQPIHWGDVANGRMEPDMVVMVDKIANYPLGSLDSERGFRPDSLFFEGAMITFQFTVALWVIGRAQNMGALPQADKFLD
jgi:hypothetical protein